MIAATGGTSSRRAYRALKALQSVGGLYWLTILWFVLLATLVAMIATEIHDLVRAAFQWATARLGLASMALTAIRLAVIALVFMGVVGLLVWQARKRLAEARPKVLVGEPAGAVGIIMFLSTPNLFNLKDCWKDAGGQGISDEDMFRKFVAAAAKHVRLVPYANHPGTAVTPAGLKQAFAIDGPISDPSVTEPGLRMFFEKFNWRMNVEALRHHAGADRPLREVILIPSSGAGGSVKWLAEAKNLLSSMLDRSGAGNVAVRNCDEVNLAENRRLPQAISYEDVEGLVDALYDLTLAVKRRHHCGERDVLVDITSGKGLNSAAGLAFAALVEDRRVQYVDTESLKVMTFDVTHEVDLKDE
jgi:hypothetical protein